MAVGGGCTGVRAEELPGKDGICHLCETYCSGSGQLAVLPQYNQREIHTAGEVRFYRLDSLDRPSGWVGAVLEGEYATIG